jgi:DNA-binding NarL/FixJ family response regulator
MTRLLLDERRLASSTSVTIVAPRHRCVTGALPRSPSVALMTVERLTATEARVAGLVAHGYADSEVAAELALQEHEFELHLASVYRKLGVGSRTELALLLGEGAYAGFRESLEPRRIIET